MSERNKVSNSYERRANILRLTHLASRVNAANGSSVVECDDAVGARDEAAGRILTSCAQCTQAALSRTTHAMICVESVARGVMTGIKLRRCRL